MVAMRAQSRTQVWQLLAVLPLASGAALIVHVLAGISLGLALLATGLVVMVAATALWTRLPPIARAEAARRARVGAFAGLLATAAYDLARWVLVTVLHYTFWPFDIFSIFGQAIGGTGMSSGAATALGILYHYTNGVMFALSYTLLLGPKGWWAGILWALGLEALMLCIYPGWLHPQAFGEFVSVSMLGHVVYGSVLGITARHLLLDDRLNRLAGKRRGHEPGEQLVP
jgi:hypothetical protein